jgi:methanogenic corrinoid protein MtbC1
MDGQVMIGKKEFTPKQVARAILVSESSIKRWCDKGVIDTRYTAGGHRRIPMSGLVEFLRSSKYALARPEVIGLPATVGQTERVIDRAYLQLTEGLIAGDEECCRRIILDLYMGEHSISTICDRVFARAFEEIGNRWECGSAEVYQERHGCEIALRLLHELRAMVAEPREEAPLAIGGAVEGDQYSLATTMVELVLRDAGWNAMSLGDNLPFTSIRQAIIRHRPKLFWLSCSHIEDQAEFISEYNKLFDELGDQVPFVIGGRAITEPVRLQVRYAAYCDTMKHLEAVAQSHLHG